MPKIGPVPDRLTTDMSNMRANNRIIGEEVARKGVISFARFMELALYCPNFGYYEQTGWTRRDEKGTILPVSARGAIVRGIARRAVRGMARVEVRSSPRPEASAGQAGVRSAEWQILEGGAHDGRLAADILRWLKGCRPEFYSAVAYWILEPSARRRESQESTLAEFRAKVRWFETWDQVPAEGVHGVIFANELLDALPAHRFGWDAAKREWFEWGVRVDGSDIVWARMEFKIQNSILKMGETRGELSTLPPRSALRVPHGSTELAEVSALEGVLPDGFTTESCPAASEWWGRAAQTLKMGKLLTFDYGLRPNNFLLLNAVTERCGRIISTIKATICWRVPANKTSPHTSISPPFGRRERARG